jgi:transposase
MSRCRMFAGIDWASLVHVACVVGPEGEVVDRFEFTHDAAAITSMIQRLKRAKASGVAIERGDGPVVEALMDSGVAVYVVPPRQVKALRERYGSAGNKDDRFDAYLLADTLRSDGHRWRPRREDSDATKPFRALCRSRKDLVEVRVGVVNQLRANLELAFPGGNRPLHQARQCDHAQLLAALSDCSEGGMVVAQTHGSLVSLRWLQRWHRPRGALWPAR